MKIEIFDHGIDIQTDQYTYYSWTDLESMSGDPDFEPIKQTILETILFGGINWVDRTREGSYLELRSEFLGGFIGGGAYAN
jgi:hypothetical protein